MFTILGESCHNGPCPTLYVDDLTGDVAVQGYRTTPHIPIPAEEDVVLIPAYAWARLLSDLPLRMLFKAVLSRRLSNSTTSPPTPARR